MPIVWRMFRLVAVDLIAGLPLVALGITFSRTLEILAVLLLVSSVLVLALLTLVAVVPQLARRVCRWKHGWSGADHSTAGFGAWCGECLWAGAVWAAGVDA